MADETTQLILGDAAVDALGQPRKRRRRRKAGPPEITHCQNCDAALTGEFCARCGQHAIDYRRSFFALLIDAADSFLNWDTKFADTIVVLLTRPWRLTNDFNAGRRVRYVHPLRLYLLASIAFFLMARLVNLSSGGPIELGPEKRAEIAATLAKLTTAESPLSPEQRAQVEDLRARWVTPDADLPPEVQRKLDKVAQRMAKLAELEKMRGQDMVRLDALLAAIPTPPPAPAAGHSPGADATAPSVPEIPKPPSPPKRGPGIHFSTSDDPTKPPSEFETWLERRVKDKVGEDGGKGELFLGTLRNNIPTMMLCCIPLFALVLKVLYIRQRRFYVEHLIYALHVHSFAYMAAIIITLLAMGAGRVGTPLQPLLAIALSFAAFGLVFISIRRVYRQGWFFTTFKFIARRRGLLDGPDPGGNGHGGRDPAPAVALTARAGGARRGNSA